MILDRHCSYKLCTKHIVHVSDYRSLQRCEIFSLFFWLLSDVGSYC